MFNTCKKSSSVNEVNSEPVKVMEQDVQYYPKTSLQFQEAVNGAKMWGIALEKTQLTYFEVAPHSRFEWHRHESEQITMVLEGVLFFEASGNIYAVEAGDVIAIPSNIYHAVYTKHQAVKAIDAWSPVYEKYSPGKQT